MSDDLIAFLRARLDEDEATALPFRSPTRYAVEGNGHARYNMSPAGDPNPITHRHIGGFFPVVITPDTHALCPLSPRAIRPERVALRTDVSDYRTLREMLGPWTSPLA